MSGSHIQDASKIRSTKKNPRVQLYVPKEETPIPLKYIDVTKSTHTDLDVLQEIRIDDHWNVDSNRFFRFMERVHKVHSIERKASRRTYVSNNYQTRSCMARIMDENW